MKMINNIKSFLYDKDYFINVFDNYVYVFNYQDLNHFSDTQINLQLEKFNIIIMGQNLCIVKMMEKEILVQGKIEGIKLV